MQVGCNISVVSTTHLTVYPRVQTASAEDVRTAISDAYDTFKAGTWSKAPAEQRSSVLAQLAQIIADNLPDLAKMETLQTGRAIREMTAQLQRVPEWL